MPKDYNFRNCQSLFGYAEEVHKRYKGICQLCGYGSNDTIKFDLWRQLTVEHLIGQNQGGYYKDIKISVGKRFQKLSDEDKNKISKEIDSLNTITACHFCNSTTSRNKSEKSMTELINKTKGDSQSVVCEIEKELKKILKQKKMDVKWKLNSIRKAYIEKIHPHF